MRKLLLITLGLFLHGGVMAATVWAPTDGNTNFLFTISYTGAGTLAMFDDQDQSYAGAALALNTNDTVSFTPSGLNYTASSVGNGGTLTLTDTTNFILGFSTDNGATWLADTSFVQLASNMYRIFFGVGETVAVDLVQVVPLPAAIWLFLSGMLGLVGYSRARR